MGEGSDAKAAEMTQQQQHRGPGPEAVWPDNPSTINTPCFYHIEEVQKNRYGWTKPMRSRKGGINPKQAAILIMKLH